MKKLIPYGISDFKDVITKFYYVDKTHFIPLVERGGSFLYLIRPRRFGKSLFLNMLDFYYNVKYKEQFDLMKGLYIYDNPTIERHSYHIMKFDFSAVSTIGDIEKNFSDYCNRKIKSFLDSYKFNIEIKHNTPAHSNLDFVFTELKKLYPDIKIYILIDEYDNFVNNILMSDKKIYEKMVSSQEAIYKEFFKLLKALTNENDSLLKKMFFTGVSPLALFDVTSGSNIGKNITNDYIFNDMVGITKEEFKKLRDYYELDFDEELLKTLDNWYDNYKFNEDVENSIYNTDMILYYVDRFLMNKKPPQELVDINVRTDYQKLKYLVHTNNKLNGNFNVLKTLFSKNYIVVDNIKDSFSAFEMTISDNFISLLYYLGLITIEGSYRGDIKLKIPNNTIQKIMAEFLNRMLSDSDTLNLDIREFDRKLKNLAFDDSLELFYFLAEKIKDNTSLRDLINQESDIKMIYMTYLSLTRLYAPISELELNQGYSDIFLIKSPNIKEDIPNILIEFKFLKQNDKSNLDEVITQAKTQLNQYAKTKKFRVDKKIVVIFKGFEMKFCEFVG